MSRFGWVGGATALVLLACGAGARSLPLECGVNGHPMTQEGYRQVPLTVQLDMVGRLGARWYRCDLGSDAAGAGAARIGELLREAGRRGVQVLPILFPPVNLQSDDPGAIRRAAREYSRAVVARFRGQARVWELHNELDAFAMIHKGERNARAEEWQWGDPDGQSPDHYEEARYSRARAALLGLAEGVRDADPSARRLINTGGWLHFGFVRRLISDGVPFEILGWHWYSEMGEITAAGGVNVLEKIAAFGKPIWINEYNRRGGNGGPDGEHEQAEVIGAMTRRFTELAATYPIRGLMAYELLDEPYFGLDNPESHMGLVGLRRGATGAWEAGRDHAGFGAIRAAFAGAGARRSRGERTLSELGRAERPGVDLRLQRSSREITASPFATLTSFEVHGEADDAGVVATMASMGVKWVMMHNIHGSLPDPADRRLNAWLRMCRAAGIGVRCILSSNDAALWRRALRNYGDRIHEWHYLNEPNAPTANDHTRPVVAPAAYAAQARAIRAIVRSERPGARLFGPEAAMLQCMEEAPYPWLRLALAAGLAGAVDGVSIHPYRQAYSPANTPENPSTFEGRAGAGYSTYEQQIGALRRMAPGKPLAVTEVGWSTAPLGPLNGSTRERITELTQAKFALRQQVMDFALGMEVATWFLLRERYDNMPCPPGHIENHFGIVHTDNTPKPAYTALQTLYSQIDGGCRSVVANVRFRAAGVKWRLFEDRRGGSAVRKLVYWLPVAARDDLPAVRTEVTVGGVTVRDVWLSDAPRILRIHRIGGRWGWPALVDLVGQSVDQDLEWEAPGPARREAGASRGAGPGAAASGRAGRRTPRLPAVRRW